MDPNIGKPVTGQYECPHRSGVGLDYFTSRIDRITLQPNGRFMLTIQNQSRVANAAQSLISGQQVTAAAPETRREGSYIHQGNTVSLHFDEGGVEQATVAANGEGMQVGPNFFNKVSDSTLLPPTHRLKQDMDDIAKGIKIASTIGGMAIKAAKTIQGTIQSTQGTEQNQASPQGTTPAQTTQAATPVNQSAWHPAPAPQPAPSAPVPPFQPEPQTPQGYTAIFCDQCGARCRPGKRFCNNCGARLT